MKNIITYGLTPKQTLHFMFPFNLAYSRGFCFLSDKTSLFNKTPYCVPHPKKGGKKSIKRLLTLCLSGLSIFILWNLKYDLFSLL